MRYPFSSSEAEKERREVAEEGSESYEGNFDETSFDISRPNSQSQGDRKCSFAHVYGEDNKTPHAAQVSGHVGGANISAPHSAHIDLSN